MRRKNLSKRRREILNYIERARRRDGYPPSVREIGAAVGLSSSSTVHSHLRALEEMGYIKRDPTKPRALRVIKPNKQQSAPPTGDFKRLPLVGRVAAGYPLLATENIEDYLSVPAEIAADNAFVLKVKGESMAKAGIEDGDYLIVRQQADADNGDIVVALIEDEATVKRLYKEKQRLRLQPENDAMEPIYSDKAVVLGKAVGLMRRL